MRKSKIKTNILAFLIILFVAFSSSILTQLLMASDIDWYTSFVSSLVVTVTLFIIDALNIMKKFKRKRKK